MYKVIILFFLLNVSLVFALEHKTIAENFLIYKGIDKKVISTKSLEKDGVIIGYIFGLEHKGFIIVPYSKKISPVKSYSYSSDYNDLPDAYKQFLSNELYDARTNKILYKVNDDDIEKRWSFLKNYKESESILYKTYSQGENLITTAWNQEYPYNKYLPKKDGKDTVVGCVQIAMGQIMKYHSYPIKGSGVVFSSKETNSVKDLKVVLNRYYNWDNMPNNLSEIEEYQEDEIAYFLRDLVVLNQAEIGYDGTGASIDTELYMKHFGYSTEIENLSLDTVGKEIFYSTLKEQIDNNLPVLFIFPSPAHMTIADGYDESQIGTAIHINMGWGESSKIFYNLDSVIDAGESSFNTSNVSMIYNIKPCSDDNNDCYNKPKLETGDIQNNLLLSGTFNTEYDTDIYPVYLSGETTLSGESTIPGYVKGQYFFIQLYDHNMQSLIYSTQNITQTLDSGLYYISVVEGFKSGGGYSHLDNHQYSVTISTSILQESEKNAIDMANVILPQIDQNISTKIIDGLTKVYIYGYGQNSEDNLTFNANSNNGNVNLSMENNILTLTPNVNSGHSKVKVTMDSQSNIDEIIFDLFIDEKTYLVQQEYTLNGKFDSQNEIEMKNVFLDGGCTIDGSRDSGDSTLLGGFYIQLLNSNSQIELPYTQVYPEISGNYTEGMYTLKSSIVNEDTGSFYSWSEDSSTYAINITCPNIKTDVNTISEKLGIILDESSFTTSNNGDNNVTLPVLEGWNLLSLPVFTTITYDQLSTLFSMANTVWKYSNGWKAYGKGILQDTLTTANIDKIVKIEKEQGFWVNASDDKNISFSGASYSIIDSITLVNATSGWYLFGTAEDINTTMIETANNNLNSIWVYNNGWKAYGVGDMADTLSGAGILPLTDINQGQGFWINIK